MSSLMFHTHWIDSCNINIYIHLNSFWNKNLLNRFKKDDKEANSLALWFRHDFILYQTWHWTQSPITDISVRRNKKHHVQPYKARKTIFIVIWSENILISNIFPGFILFYCVQTDIIKLIYIIDVILFHTIQVDDWKYFIMSSLKEKTTHLSTSAFHFYVFFC